MLYYKIFIFILYFHLYKHIIIRVYRYSEYVTQTQGTYLVWMNGLFIE